METNNDLREIQGFEDWLNKQLKEGELAIIHMNHLSRALEQINNNDPDFQCKLDILVKKYMEIVSVF